MTLKKCIIFGTGKFAKDAFSVLNNRNMEVSFFLDNDVSRIGYFMGKPVYGVDKLEFTNLPIIICSTWVVQILEQVSKIGYKGKVFVIDPFLTIFDDFDLSDNTLQEINDFYESLDNESKEILRGVIGLRIGDFSSLKVSNYNQYYHPELIFSDSDVFIDGGAYTGDTVHFFEKKGVKLKEFHCFEPDCSNFNELLKHSGMNHVFKINAGLWSTSGYVSFLSSNDSTPYCGKIKIGGDKSIRVLSVDDYCKKNFIKPTLVKMDIEGAEYEALVGARETIINEKPKLAISIYHRYNDIWFIQRFIKSLRPDYKFFLGHHSNTYLETILYAI